MESECRSKLNIGSLISNQIMSRRLLSRTANLRTNLNEPTNNFDETRYKQDYQWITDSAPIKVQNNEFTENSGEQSRNVTNSRRNSRTNRQLNKQFSFEEPPNNLNKLFAESSVPGVRDIAGARSLLRKIFWLISFFFFGILALKDISQLVSEYYVYPITVDVRLRDSRRLLFPAITVCNLNIVRYSALCNTTVSVINSSMIPQDLKDKLCGIQATAERPVTPKPIEKPKEKPKEVKPTEKSTETDPENPLIDDINNYGTIGSKKSETPPPNIDLDIDNKKHLERSKRQANRNNWIKFLNDSQNNTQNNTQNITQNKDTNETKPLLNKKIITTTEPTTTAMPVEEYELTEREEKELQENLTNWLAVIYNSNEKLAKQLSHQFEDMILRCTIKATNCTHPNSFDHIFTPTEGNCFTYKSSNRNTRFHSKQEETSIAGVNYGLELVLNLETSEYLPGSAQIGAIVMVHHPEEFGNSASEAIFVAPQQATYIGLKMINITRLPKPYPEECINQWPTALSGRLTQNATYSQQACLKICLQRTIQRRCQCQSAMLPQLELNSTLKICDTRRRVTRGCVEEVMFRAEDKVNDCLCPPRCQVVNYDKTVSMARWPTREDRVTFDRGKTNINFQNLAKVTIYFQTMTCQEVTQEKAYTTAKLFSSLGGILGMYVGFSFLSLFEILEVVVRRFWYFCTKKKNRFKAAVHTITATLAMNNNYHNNYNNNSDTRRVRFQR